MILLVNERVFRLHERVNKLSWLTHAGPRVTLVFYILFYRHSIYLVYYMSIAAVDSKGVRNVFDVKIIKNISCNSIDENVQKIRIIYISMHAHVVTVIHAQFISCMISFNSVYWNIFQLNRQHFYGMDTPHCCNNDIYYCIMSLKKYHTYQGMSQTTKTKNRSYVVPGNQLVYDWYIPHLV